MDPTTREIVDPAQVGTALAVLSFAALAGACACMFAGRVRGSAPLVRAALACAAVMPLYPLWVVYNAIEDRFGLESVAALLINAALFAAVGAGGGVLMKRLWPAGEGGEARPPAGE